VRAGTWQCLVLVDRERDLEGSGSRAAEGGRDGYRRGRKRSRKGYGHVRARDGSG
jgi:hypothetical protein